MNMRLSFLFWLAMVVVAGCGGHKPKTQLPAAPTPPTEALAWLPGDATIVGHVALEPFRTTPLWAMWNDVQREQRGFASWIDLALVDHITLGGQVKSERESSFVAAIEGRFGAGYLDNLALTDKTPVEQRGLLRIYQRDEGAWAQIAPGLLVVCSADRLERVIARASAGPGFPVKEGVLYRSLAARVGIDRADLSLLADDPDGRGREALNKQGDRYGIAPMANDVLRAGLSLDMGPNVVVAAIAETPDGPRALELQRNVDETLGSLSSNMFVAMLGLRPVVNALKASSDGSYVAVRGSIAEADLRSLLGKLQTMLQVAMSQGEPMAPSTP